MSKEKKKLSRKIKKGHAWISLVAFFLLSVLATAILLAIIEAFSSYMVGSKLDSEYEAIRGMAVLYDKSEALGEADHIYDLINAEGRTYYITDAKGAVLYQNGEITASPEVYDVFVITSTNEVRMRNDTQHTYLQAEENGLIAIDFMRAFRYVWKNRKQTDKLVDEGLMVRLDRNGSTETYSSFFFDDGFNEKSELRFPVWIEIPVKEGGECFVAKAYLRVNLGDVGWLVVLISMVAVLTILILIVFVVHFMTSFSRQRRMIRILTTDQVTLGYNWIGFQDKSERLLKKRSQARNGFAVVDLVFVNYRNYCMCHSVEDGDRVLQKIYDMIGEQTEKKELIARSGASEFAMLLKFEDEERLRNRIQALISRLEKLDDEHVFRFQAGIDLIPVLLDKNNRAVRRRSINVQTEYNNACTAQGTLSESESSGVAIFDDKLVEDQRWIDQVQEKQQQALDNEEFQVYYQPKYDPSTHELKGAEALIRWQSPEFGLVSPGRIIPIFEKNGFITEIDHYMITHVARDQRKWLDEGYHCVPVSVNVSRAHFIEADLAEQIRDMIDAEGTPHKLVEIELTESAFFDDKNAIINTINKLKAYGFTVSMDDFGSGYSSLNSLKDMPLDVLKLDAEFFRGDNTGERGEIVVKEAIRLAQKLNMRTVAEGVEIKEQVDFLAEQGCDMIQGYYFAKPMPKTDYEERMKTGRQDP